MAMNAKHIMAAITGLALVAMPVSASAHGSMKPSHGGIVAIAGETMVELVRKPAGVDIYITEEDEPLAATGFTGKLIVTADGAKSDAVLVAQDANRMTAAGLAIPAGAKVVAALTGTASGTKTFVTFMIK
jgi:hypothetical protein